MATTRVNGIDVHVQRLGHDSGSPRPVVVLIHGLLIDTLASYYFSLAPRLAEEGLDVVMYDLRGHGKTSRPPTGYRMEDFVADLDGLLDALAIDRPVHLVGNSFGGAVAYAMAAARPERVASVIAIEAEPPARTWAETMSAGLVGEGAAWWSRKSCSGCARTPAGTTSGRSGPRAGCSTRPRSPRSSRSAL